MLIYSKSLHPPTSFHFRQFVNDMLQVNRLRRPCSPYLLPLGLEVVPCVPLLVRVGSWPGWTGGENAGTRPTHKIRSDDLSLQKERQTFAVPFRHLRRMRTSRR